MQLGAIQNVRVRSAQKRGGVGLCLVCAHDLGAGAAEDCRLSPLARHYEHWLALHGWPSDAGGFNDSTVHQAVMTAAMNVACHLSNVCSPMPQ